MPETTSLFNKIAKHYDSLNTFFSFGMDKIWRRKLVEQINGSKLILDIATCTGEVALETVNKLQSSKVIGLDPSIEMLGFAKKKCNPKEITLVQGYAEQLPFKKNEFDAITIAFGIRNVASIENALVEINRVLKCGGKFLCLEFSAEEIQRSLFGPYFQEI